VLVRGTPTAAVVAADQWLSRSAFAGMLQGASPATAAGAGFSGWPAVYGLVQQTVGQLAIEGFEGGQRKQVRRLAASSAGFSGCRRMRAMSRCDRLHRHQVSRRSRDAVCGYKIIAAGGGPPAVGLAAQPLALRVDLERRTPQSLRRSRYWPYPHAFGHLGPPFSGGESAPGERTWLLRAMGPCGDAPHAG